MPETEFYDPFDNIPFTEISLKDAMDHKNLTQEDVDLISAAPEIFDNEIVYWLLKCPDTGRTTCHGVTFDETTARDQAQDFSEVGEIISTKTMTIREYLRDIMGLEVPDRSHSNDLPQDQPSP